MRRRRRRRSALQSCDAHLATACLVARRSPLRMHLYHIALSSLNPLLEPVLAPFRLLAAASLPSRTKKHRRQPLGTPFQALAHDTPAASQTAFLVHRCRCERRVHTPQRRLSPRLPRGASCTHQNQTHCTGAGHACAAPVVNPTATGCAKGFGRLAASRIAGGGAKLAGGVLRSAAAAVARRGARHSRGAPAPPSPLWMGSSLLCGRSTAPERSCSRDSASGCCRPAQKCRPRPSPRPWRGQRGRGWFGELAGAR